MPKAMNPVTQGVVSAALADTNNLQAPLVSYLKRLRDLDDTAIGLSASITKVVDRSLDDTRGGKRGKSGSGTDLNNESFLSDLKKSVAVADEKVALAQQCYDLVEQHIARLDKDLRVFDNALAEKEAQVAIAKGLVVPPKAVGNDGQGGLSNAINNVVQPTQAGTAAVAHLSDLNEQKFCVCNRVSFGEMIACENEECAIEWFHFACVGLSTDAKIKGKWYCTTCSAERRRLKKLEAKLEAEKNKK